MSFKKFAKRHSVLFNKYAVSDYSVLFNKYAVSVRNHITKGICIPLDVRRVLVKNVTIRRHGQCEKLPYT